jgi:CHASE1-domain containing sensor protein
MDEAVGVLGLEQAKGNHEQRKGFVAALRLNGRRALLAPGRRHHVAERLWIQESGLVLVKDQRALDDCIIDAILSAPDVPEIGIEPLMEARLHRSSAWVVDVEVL